MLAVAILARYRRHLVGGWRRTYVITAVIALYFNVFVLVVQLFEKVPSLHALAPKGSEPPFAITQGIVMVVFIAAGVAAVKGPRRSLDRSQPASARRVNAGRLQGIFSGRWIAAFPAVLLRVPQLQ